MVHANSALLEDVAGSKSSELRTRTSSDPAESEPMRLASLLDEPMAPASEPSRAAALASAPGIDAEPSAAPHSGWPAPPWLHDSDVARRYRVDGVLGTGGMGIVYAATHLELDLPVALKVMRADLTEYPEALARFCTEARANAALRSRHVLRVFDAGGLGSARGYVVTERLEGNNLAEIVQSRGRLPAALAVDYTLQAAAALAEAHELGLIHRDIKPENLFLAQIPGEAPIIKVMDFGIARWLSRPEPTRLTHPKASLGSPCYQSPEQMANVLDADARSDIWALGLVLFELLTGKCPFEGETIQETCWKVLKGPRPSLLAERPELDPGLAAIVERCLEFDRSERWASMRQLAAALGSHSSQAQANAADVRAADVRAADVKAANAWGVNVANLDASQPIPLLRPLASRGLPEKRRRSRLWSSVAAFGLGAASSVAFFEARDLDFEGARRALLQSSHQASLHAEAMLRQLMQAAEHLAAPSPTPP